MLPFQQIEKSYEIAAAGGLAMKLAFDRKRKSIGFEEYFSAIYLVDREALVPFWRNSKKLDLFVRNSCGLTEPVWFYWIDLYYAMREDPKWRDGISAPYSRSLAGILNEAAKLALKGIKNSSTKPEFGIRHFIKVLAASPRVKFSRKMLDSGIKRQFHARTKLRAKSRRGQD